MKNIWLIEITDTFSGEANYSWVLRYYTEAETMLGAVNKLSRRKGSGWRKTWGNLDSAAYKQHGACIIMFVDYASLTDMEWIKDHYQNLEEL